MCICMIVEGRNVASSSKDQLDLYMYMYEARDVYSNITPHSKERGKRMHRACYDLNEWKYTGLNRDTNVNIIVETKV